MTNIVNINQINTLGQLKSSGYVSRSIKEEMRSNLITKLRNKEKVFSGILGFDDTVLPDIERAILSQHNILLLGLRGQAKTRIARLLTTLLDEYMPIVKDSELNDDPLKPLSKFALDTIETLGDETPVSWVHRNERYVEKLATPDVSIADLIGDVDPIKAANLKLPYSDERVIHFGLIPRSHRSIFVINELPDLQARIQVSLFNILQEGDLQIRGFKLRLPLEISFVFTANPEDYTNRGSIITPLKDRIESQILTHYPRSIETSMSITGQEARLSKDQYSQITIPFMHRKLIEMISFNARESEYVDAKSGVSARLSISALENLYSTAERRMLLNNEQQTSTRITDFWGVIPAITGKVELVYEGEQEGPYNVAMHLLFKACKELFLEHFPNPNQKLKRDLKDEYGVIKAYFSGGNSVELLNDENDDLYAKKINLVVGLQKFTESYMKHGDDLLPMMELVLFGLAETEVIGKNILENSLEFSDPLSDILNDLDN
ncbi:MAG: magnesium chelatase [Saprospiraceae bacterium]|nr:magnesium chelatase [Saprospiraceae bacterium]